MDLISREQAQARLKEICKKYSIMYDDSSDNKYNACASEFGHAFDDLPAQNQWIPCNERMPKLNEEVIVQGGNSLDDEIFIAKLRENDSLIKNYLEIDSELIWENCNSYNEFNDVIAWQPLPEPYKESKEE